MYNEFSNEIYTSNDKNNENIIENIEEIQDKVNEIKYGILTVKLSILNNILKSKIKTYFSFFLNKIFLKRSFINLFSESDNFLEIIPKNHQKIDYYKYYSIKRLIYIIKDIKFRHYLKKNAFLLWKIQTKFLPNSIIKNNKYSNYLYNLIFIISKIIHKKNSIFYKKKILLFLWFEKIKKKNIRTKRGIIIIKNLLNRRISNYFYLFHQNYFYLKYKSNIMKEELKDYLKKFVINDKDIYYKTLIDYYSLTRKLKNYQKKSILLKLFNKIEIKNYINQNLFQAFYKMRFFAYSISSINNENKKLNEILLNLKCDTLINSSLIIKTILNNKIKNSILFKKRIFLNRLIEKSNMINTILEYKNKYKLLPSLIEEKNKSNFCLLRNNFKKIILLRNIFLIRIKHKNIFTEYNISINQYDNIQTCFNKWKQINNDIKTKNEIKLFKFSEIYYLIKKKIILNNGNKFLGNLLIKSYKKTFIHNYSKQYLYVLISLLRNILHKKFLFFLMRFKVYKSSYFNDNLKKIKLKQIFLYFQYFKKLKNKKRKNYSYYELSKLYELYLLYFKKKIMKYINKWRKNLRIANIKIYKNNNRIIDKNIFKNMTYILLEYEKQDDGLYKEISLIKKSLNKPNILFDLILKKHYRTLLNYFIIWYKVINSSSSLCDLYIQSEKIKEENNILINTYYKKKNQFKKVISDYRYMKKHYCEKCIGENLEIDYKSIKSDELNEIEDTETNNINENFESNIINSSDDEVLNENKQIQVNTSKSLNTVADRENRIKEYQNEYKKLVEEYEETISDLNKKKEELLELKKQFLAKKNNN